MCVCVYNLHARIQLVYMDMYQASFCVGVNVFKHCGFLIITSMGGFLLHQRIVCSVHECVCVSVCVSLCVCLCVLYQRIVCSLHKCVCVCVCVLKKSLWLSSHHNTRSYPTMCAHTQGLMKVVYTHFTSFDISRNGPYIG